MPDNTEWFVKRFDLPIDDVIALENEVREEFPNDEMMYELHLIRALMQREEETKNLSFEDMEKLRTERLERDLREDGYELERQKDGTYRLKNIK